MVFIPKPDASQLRDLNRLHALCQNTDRPAGLDDHDIRAVRQFWSSTPGYDRDRPLTAPLIRAVFPDIDLDALNRMNGTRVLATCLRRVATVGGDARWDAVR